MKKGMPGKNSLALCVSGILALELLLLTDAVIVFRGGEMAPVVAAGMAVVLMTCILLLSRRFLKGMAAAALLIPVTAAVILAGGIACWRQFSTHAGYNAVDDGKHQIFGDRRVMLIVPHQDDDINILGGVLEEYVRYGSRLYPVFVTNGDYHGKAEERFSEAVRVFEKIGVSEDQVIFLGYGDGWNAEGPHIYNAPSGVVMESHFGRTETYGTAVHSPYREGREYTVDNMMEDMAAVILEYRPDVIFCSDYDNHIDHKSTTLLFEKTMGKLLKEHPEYKPVVYKAYAYGTAWEAVPDFYADNILSTQNHFADPYGQQPAIYRWEDRVRFPVKAEGLSRSLVNTEGYALLDLYASQGANLQAAGLINGDKVAWRRHTNSLCRESQITVTSGNGELLNDFMLIENHDLVDEHHMPYDGVWIPENEDSEKTLKVTLPQTGRVHSIVLYDHPSKEHNILNAKICFDDETCVETGPLDPNGAATVITVEQEHVSSFQVILTELQGTDAGLSEIEAFEQEPQPDGSFIKLTDEEGNFLYDYMMPENGTARLQVYVHGAMPTFSEDAYAVEIVDGQGTAAVDNGVIRVSCREGEGFVLTVTCTETGITDSAYIHNPSPLNRKWLAFWQKTEETVFTCYSGKYYKHLLIYRIPDKISYEIRHR